MYKKIILFCLALALVSCQKTSLYSDLAEEDVNEIMVLLEDNGIDVSKVKEVRQNEVYWSVAVPAKSLKKARALLLGHNLPRHRELGLSGVYKEKGLIPTPDEQKARFLLALKGEIVNSLEKIPEVVDADVVLNTPTPEEFAKGEKKRPTASVVVKAKTPEGGQSTLTESKVQQFVANSVEDLNPRDVSVIITYMSEGRGLMPGETLVLPPQERGVEKLPTTRVVGVEVTKAGGERLKVYLAVFFGILVILSAALIITIVRTARMRQELKSYQGSKALVEGSVVEEKEEGER